MLQKLNNRPFHPDDTDMRPYRPGRPFAPDKGDPFPGPFRDGRGGGNGGNGGGGGILSAFLPGQKDALAQQLANGFGGGNKQWKGILGQTYAPITSAVDFEYGGGVKGKNGGKGDGKKNPDDPATMTALWTRMFRTMNSATSAPCFLSACSSKCASLCRSKCRCNSRRSRGRP
jgi:hypothetical protein